MKIELIKNPFLKQILTYVKECNENIIIYCPYVKKEIVSKILNLKENKTKLKLVTSWKAYNFASKSSDLAAIKLLIENNNEVFYLKNIHAKIYIFDEKKALISSANLTENGLNKNFEYGVLIENNNLKIAEILNDLNNNELSEINSKMISIMEKEIKKIEPEIKKIENLKNELKKIEINFSRKTNNSKNNNLDSTSNWRKEIMKIIYEITKEKESFFFSSKDFYSYEQYLKEKFPNAKNPLRTTAYWMQKLRDEKIISFLDYKGNYKLNN